MTPAPKALVVLLEPEDLRPALPEWPGVVCLAVCLMRNGDLITLLFRREERMEVPARLVEMLSLADPEVAFVPEVPGFPTQPFLYSDERRLMALLSASVDLLDEADDYMVNYTYAMEEGLDPALMLGQAPRAVQMPMAAAAPRPVVAQPQPPMAEPMRQPIPEAPRYVAEPLRQPAAQAPRAFEEVTRAPAGAEVQPMPRPVVQVESRAAKLAGQAGMLRPAAARAGAPGAPGPSPILPDFLRKSAEQRHKIQFSTVRTVAPDTLIAAE